MGVVRRTKEDVAHIILDMGYVEMRDWAEQLVASVNGDKEDGIEPDPGNVEWWCEKLRWSAVGIIDASED